MFDCFYYIKNKIYVPGGIIAESEGNHIVCGSTDCGAKTDKASRKTSDALSGIPYL